MTDKDNSAADHESRVNWLVSLRACIIETQTELRYYANRPAPKDTSALVETEITIAALEERERKLTQQYREELLAHVQASEDDQ